MKISRKNLGSIIPQRSAVSASKEDLQGEFKVVEITPRRNATTDNVDVQGDRTNEELGELQVRLMSVKSNRMFVMSLRQFIGLPESAPTASSEDVAKAMLDANNKPSNFPVGNALSPLYAGLLDIDGEEDVDFPDAIEFTYIADRMSTDGTKKVYTAGLYKDFQLRVDKDRAAWDTNPANAGKSFDIGTIYDDFNFMRNLENTALANEAASPEAQKILVIKKIEK